MPDAPPTTVLLLEDSPTDAELVGFMLSESSPEAVDVVHCARLEDVRRFLYERDASCALVDLGLPDADGLDVIVTLREEAPELPVVVLSGATDEGLALRAVQEGAQDYLMKGEVNAARLTRAIRYAIERKRVEIELAHRALHDPLTGLANRRLLLDRLAHALAHRDPRCAVLFLDLDGFKAINDRLGHEVGDRVLIEVARRLTVTLRPADTVARLGGDEFVVLCENLGREDVRAVAERVRAAVSKPHDFDVGEVLVPASVGVAVADDGADAAALLAAADQAMYEAKRAKRGVVVA